MSYQRLQGLEVRGTRQKLIAYDEAGRAGDAKILRQRQVTVDRRLNIGQVLGAILTVSAASATAVDGAALLAIYSLGLGVPFLLAALFTDSLAAGSRPSGASGAPSRSSLQLS